MKRLHSIIFIMLFLTTVIYAQNIDNADFVSPMNNEMIAVKKGSQWAFINSEGSVAINFRDDLVVSKNAHGSYPIFQNGRCLIT